MKNLLLALLIVATAGPGCATTIDSLENVLKTATGEAKVKVMNELFRAHINSDPVKAIAYTRDALTLATSINDKKGMAACYNNLGVAYKNQGALDMALENYLRSLDLYTAIQNGEGVATTKNNIANLYSLKKDYGQALKYFEESHNGFIALGDAEKIIGSMNNLGNLHSDLQLYDQALNYYTEAFKMSEKNGAAFPDPLTNIGNLFYRQGNYQRAGEYYQRALTLVRNQHNKIGEISLLANIGEVYTKAKQPKEASNYLDQALALANEMQASFYLPQIYKITSANFASQGKMKEAYEFMLRYDEAREKVYGEESSRRIAQMDVALELREKEKEIDNLLVDDQVKTLKLRNTQIVITAVVLSIVAAVALANLFFIGKRSKRQK